MTSAASSASSAPSSLLLSSLALSAGSLVALDFDGTLAPIELHPEDARPVAGVDQVLRRVRATGAALAVVSGRSVESLLRISGFGAIPGIVIYGTHGAERWQAGVLRAVPAPPGLADLRDRLPGLVAEAVREPEVWIENKSLSLVVHARLTPDPDRVLSVLRGPVEKAAAAAGLAVRPGKEVLEICLPGIDKGTALRELLDDRVTDALYAGDDVGDLEAMAEVRAWARRSGRPGWTVAVGPADGPLAGAAADVTVPDPGALLGLLSGLLLAGSGWWLRGGGWWLRGGGWWLRGGGWRLRGGGQGQDRGADGVVDDGQDLGFGPLGAIVPLGERADAGQPDLG